MQEIIIQIRIQKIKRLEIFINMVDWILICIMILWFPEFKYILSSLRSSTSILRIAVD